MLRYEFVREFTPMDAVLARRFRTYGVADGVARRLLREHGRGFLIECMDRFDLLIQDGVLVIKKSKAAALMHLIAHPDAYPYPGKAAQSAARVASTAAKPSATRMTPLIEPPSVADEFQGLSAEQTAEKVISRMTFHYRRLLTVVDLDHIRAGILAGDTDGLRLLEEAMSAVGRMEKDAFAAQLKAGLVSGRPD